jgi:hypothetical protein
MIIDVLINSCARPDSMDVCLNSFFKHIKTFNHEFRFVFVEDVVDNKERQMLGRTWVENNQKYFDEIIFLEKKAGFGFHFQEVVKRGKSEIFFRLEDDQKFIVDVDIDPLVEILVLEELLCSIMLRRDVYKNKFKQKKIINGVKLQETDFYSDSIGLHKLSLTKTLIDKCGWNNQLHESGVLTPQSLSLGFVKYVLDYKDFFWQRNPVHYIHAGKDYRQGTWKI